MTSDEFYIVLPSILCLSLLCFPIGMWFCSKFGVKKAFALGGSLCTLSIFIASFTTTAAGFYFAFVPMFTFGKGFIYTASLLSGWSHLPGKKGLVSGITTAGNGIGGLVWSLMTTAIVNPENLSSVATDVGDGNKD